MISKKRLQDAAATPLVRHDFRITTQWINLLRELLFGGQFVFPSTQNPSTDPNVLDDYEEGDWTPALTFATPGDLSVAYSTQDGDYTKIGRNVRATVTLVTSTFTHSTASGAARVTGLPFTSANNGVVSMGALDWQGITKANFTDVNLRLTPASAIINLRACGSGQTAADIATGDMPTAGTVRVVGTLNYPANA